MTNYMDISEFTDLGFLQEANRQFFHPLGLALEVAHDKTTGEWWLSGIWDYRDDPEGIVFDDIPESFIAKAAHVRDERERHRAARDAMFGQVVQPLGNEPLSDDDDYEIVVFDEVWTDW